MFQPIDAAQLFALPKAAPTRFGEGNNSSEICSALAPLDDDELLSLRRCCFPLDILRSRAVRLPASGRGRAGGASAPKLSASTRGVRLSLIHI